MAALEGYCRRSIHDRNAVEDVLQEAVGKAFRDFDLYAEGTNFRAWIFRYLTLEILAGNRLYHRHHHEWLAGEPTVSDEWCETADATPIERLLEDPDPILNRCDESLAEAIRQLPALERSTLLLRVLGGFKHREMAEILGIPIGTVMSSLSRARTRLRSKLAGFASDHGFIDRLPVRNPK